MANKVPWYHLFDWREVSGLLLVISALALLVLFFKLPELTRRNKLEKYSSEAVGYIIDVKDNIKLRQTSEGGKAEIHSFTLKYSFEADDQVYESTDELKFTPVNKFNLNKCLNQDSGRVKIKYKPKNPNQSLIVWE